MKRRFSVNTSFTDLLFNIIQAFFLILLLVITVVNPPAKKNSDIELKAEFLITLEWEQDSKSDVDLIVQTPSKEICFYGRKDIKAASLDRDDTGLINDTFKLDDGSTAVIKENWEHISIRKAIPGEYVVNVLLYAKRDVAPIKVNVKVEKLNPYSVVYAGTVDLLNEREERTMISFKLDKEGRVTQRSNTQQDLLQKILNNYQGGITVP